MQTILKDIHSCKISCLVFTGVRYFESIHTGAATVPSISLPTQKLARWADAVHQIFDITIITITVIIIIVVVIVIVVITFFKTTGQTLCTKYL